MYVYARRHRTSDRDIDELYKFIIYRIEDLLSNALPHEERLVIVFDLANFTYDSMDYEAVKALIAVLQYNYPDSLHMIHIVNEPWYVSGVAAISSVAMYLSDISINPPMSDM